MRSTTCKNAGTQPTPAPHWHCNPYHTIHCQKATMLADFSAGTSCRLATRKAQRCKLLQTLSKRCCTITHLPWMSHLVRVPFVLLTYHSVLQLREAFDLLGNNSDLMLELDGFTVISNSPLSLFRDGDTVIIRSKSPQPNLPTTHGNQSESNKRPYPEPALALTTAGGQVVYTSPSLLPVCQRVTCCKHHNDRLKANSSGGMHKIVANTSLWASDLAVQTRTVLAPCSMS